MSLQTRAIRGVAWTIATSTGTRVLGLVGTLVLVRYVAPDEYGSVLAASVLVSSASQLSTLGVGTYIIAHPKSGRAVNFHASLIHILLGTVALGSVVLLHRPICVWLDAPTLGRYIPGLALSVLFDRVSFMPERILARDLRFGRLAAGRSTGELAYTFISVAAAMAGWGGASVVVGNLARSLLRTLMALAAVDRREWLEPCVIEKRRLRILAGYGLTVWVCGLAAFAARRWDNLLVGHFFGMAVLGTYNLAYNLADIPAVQVGEQIGEVLFPSLVQVEPERRQQALLRSIALVGLIMFPLAVGLGAVAPTIVRAVLADSWSGVGPMLVLLSALSVSRPITGVLGAYLNAVAKPRLLMWIDIGQVVLLMVAISTIGRLGPLWTCTAVGVVFIWRALANMWVLRASDGIPLRSFLRQLAPPLIACAPMILAVLGARWGLGYLGLKQQPALALVGETVVGALAYVASALVIAPATSHELLRLTRLALHSGDTPRSIAPAAQA
jgi:lipopolysaccharide exporter